MPTTDDDAPPLTTNDLAALEQALKLTRQESAGRAAQIALKLAEDGWWNTACFAAFNCQCSTLHLKPWEHAPCWVDDPDDYPDPEAARLLKRMLKAGVSRYHPDPLAAIEAAEKAARSAG
jgi:hypothetical protein